MDHYGIGVAIRGAVMVYLNSARGTGRTTSLVESVKDGDRIVFTNKQEADRVRKLCVDRGVNVDCIIIDPAFPHRILERPTSHGRTLLDHSWVERYYQLAMERAAIEIDNMEQSTSGYGVAHRETLRKAEAIIKPRPDKF